MKRRRLPSWCRHPWKPLPKRWHRWVRCQTHPRITPAEIAFIVEAMRLPVRRSRVTRLDRIRMPVLAYLRASRAARRSA